MTRILKLVSFNSEIVPQKSRAKLRLVSYNSKSADGESESAIGQSILPRPKSSDYEATIVAEIFTNGGAGFRIIQSDNVIMSQVLVSFDLDSETTWKTIESVDNIKENEVRLKNWLLNQLIKTKIVFENMDNLSA